MLSREVYEEVGSGESVCSGSSSKPHRRGMLIGGWFVVTSNMAHCAALKKRDRRLIVTDTEETVMMRQATGD